MVRLGLIIRCEEAEGFARLDCFLSFLLIEVVLEGGILSCFVYNAPSCLRDQITSLG